MARPGFVLEVDDRTPPLVVADGDAFRLERFPLGTRVVYPAESLPALPDVAEAINAALEAPLDSAPLSALLRPGMRLTVAVDDITTPLPRMQRPDVRGRIVEAVLRRAAAVGVDDVQVVVARGLRRRMTETELQHLLGERVFRSFFADGLLTSSDAEDADQLVEVAEGDGPVAVQRSAVEADLLVFVHLADRAGNGLEAVVRGLGSAATLGRLAVQPEDLAHAGNLAQPAVGAGAAAVAAQVGDALRVFQVEAVLDNAAVAPPLLLLGKREWEWNLKDQAAWLALHRGLSLTTAKARRRLLNAASSNYAPIQVAAGAPDAVARASAAAVAAQRVVEVHGQADVAVLGVPHATPDSVDSVTNPILAAWSALGAGFNARTGAPVVRAGGALILYSPMAAAFSSLHHPSSVDFFAEVLPTTTDAAQLQEKFEDAYARDPWYTHLYRTSYAFHGVHPFLLWYEMAAARRHCDDIVVVGGHRPTVERLGLRAASTLADALEIVSSTVGRSPSITYLHNPAQLVADVR